MAKTRETELFNAFLWTCDDCGRDNFERGITVEPEAIDTGELPEDIAEWVDAGGNFDAMRAPASVKCQHCAGEFRVTSYDGEAADD